ncbi:GNAT family N-acetyltransferase [Muricauda sp. HICW]|uniref:GNAT family N-acetyltransferase n=1 Tax=Flagellimonas chongwuensis TaxID=2697365 RepID=A0A850NGT8_9FLAO|nr:GNAT family N-acetyltransferase [Allomuricauda chongwuensis]NVN19344.1 GNAT family N-acetyltransferase [Allomuricauda chongwuensis]
MSKVKHINIFQSLYERGNLPMELMYAKIMDTSLEEDGYTWLQQGKNAISCRLVPSYFTVDQLFSCNIRTVDQYNWGYSIDLSNCSSIDDYLSSQFKSKPRSIIRRYVNRLETCFPISYKLYHGELEKEIYNAVFDSLRDMIKKRFQEREETHKEMWRWEGLKQNTYQQILNKQASLFVIYDGNKPIEISLNYHMGPVLFSSVSSYDLDYGKFGLGHVEIYKQLEWCLSNGYKLFEMGVGGMDYKRKWSNHIYQFSHWIITPKENFFLGLVGKIELWKVRLKEYLKSKKMNELRDRVIELINFDKTKKIVLDEVDFSTEAVNGHIDFQMLTLLTPKEVEQIEGLRKAINDFLYTNTLGYSKIKVYKANSNSRGFLVGYNYQGKDKFIELTR